MRIIHISDTHIGLNRWSRTTDLGHNLRGEDFLESFKWSMKKACELNPDFIINSGDLFDSVVVADRYIYEVQKTLSKVNCPMIIVAGNHDSPKSQSAINPILLLDVLPNIEIVHKEYKRINLSIDNSIVEIHAVPHIVAAEDFTKTLKEIRLETNSNYKIAVTHGARPFGNYKYSEDGHMIPDEFINKQFDYIALGDYHLTKKIHDRCYYSGSTDIFRSSEVSNKCFLVVDIEGNKIDVSEVNIPVRDCYKITIDCLDKELEEIYTSLNKYTEDNKDKIKDSVIYLELINMNASVRDSIDRRHVKNIFSECFYLQNKITTTDKHIGDDGSTAELIDGIIPEWKKFSGKKKEIMDLGEKYLNMVMEKK